MQELIDTMYRLEEIEEIDVSLILNEEDNMSFERSCFFYDIVQEKYYITTFETLSNLKDTVIKMNEEFESDPRNIKCYILHGSNIEDIIDEERYTYLLNKYDYADKFTRKEDNIYIDYTKAVKMVLVNFGIKLDNIRDVLIKDFYFENEYKIKVTNL